MQNKLSKTQLRYKCLLENNFKYYTHCNLTDNPLYIMAFFNKLEFSLLNFLNLSLHPNWRHFFNQNPSKILKKCTLQVRKDLQLS